MLLPIMSGISIAIGTGAALSTALQSAPLGFSLGAGIGIAITTVFTVVLRKRKTG